MFIFKLYAFEIFPSAASWISRINVNASLREKKKKREETYVTVSIGSTLRTYTNGEEFSFRMETILIENQVGIRVD